VRERVLVPVLLEIHHTHTHTHTHTHRAVSAGVSELKTRISGRSLSGGRPLVADAILAKVEAEEAAKRADRPRWTNER
jgi:pyruvate/oxaloacetate carboxyltransferase